MDLAGFQEDSAEIANALLRDEHLVVGLNHSNTNFAIPRFRKSLEV